MHPILSLRLWIGQKRYGTIGDVPCHSGVLVSPTRVIKGPCEEAEVEALRFVAANTSIPVPKLFKTHHRRGRLYIEMEHIPGEDLAAVWTTSLSAEQKRQIVREIGGHVRALRALKPPRETMVASADGKACFDSRLGQRPVGPFQNHDDFNSFLRGYVPLDRCADAFGERVMAQHTRKYRSCFTHADLQLQNIIVREGKLVAIVDWRFAGWFPEYWEWTKAHYIVYKIPDWYELLGSELSRYDEELTAERAIWTMFD